MSTNIPRVLYGEASYRAIVKKNGYYVDKTPFIPVLENFDCPVFLRPRRFGKSLLCTTLQYYYDINFADQFADLFGNTWIGQHPTSEQGSYFVLHFDFSVIDPSGSMEKIVAGFNSHVAMVLKEFLITNRDRIPDAMDIELKEIAGTDLALVARLLKAYGLPPLYIIIDEYDNFANQLIVDRKDSLYREITGEGGFLKSFFKTLKQCRKQETIARIFITGVLPITIDDLASGFNIANFITLDDRFQSLAGFTQSEVDQLLDRIYNDYELDEGMRPQVTQVIKSNYNGYFITNTKGEGLYNSTILIYFLEKLTHFKTIPEFLTDINLKTDIAWVRRLTSSNPDRTRELVDTLTIENRLPYNKIQLRDKFDMSLFFERSFYPISFFYLGMLTREDNYYMRIPNLNMRAIFGEYFSEVHHVDLGTLYSELMSKFSKSPDLPELFKGYWDIYLAQIPEAAFAAVNENFYRTTFFLLCYQFLSHLYVWRMEHSYPGGRSDLEMEGKYHTEFARNHYLMEFKYISNASCDKEKINITSFQADPVHLEQLKGYHSELETQYPERNLRAYLIYCFGNRGFRMFESGG